MIRRVLFGVLAVALSAAVARAQLTQPPAPASLSDSIMGKIDATRGTVRRELEHARDARDVVRVLCLNDKLSQIDAARRAVEDRGAALSRASSSEGRDHEIAMLKVLGQRVEQLGAEAMACIGSEMAFIGQTVVTVTGEPGPPGDLTDFPPANDPGIVMMPPVSSSPYGL